METKTIVFDIDDTLTTTNSWALLNIAAGMTEDEDYALYKGFIQGAYDYNEWNKRITDRYIAYNILTEPIAVTTLNNYQLRPDAQKTIETLTAKGHTCILITGGFKHTATAVAQELGITTYYYVTDLVFQNGIFSHFESKGEEGEAKLQLLKKYCQEYQIELTDCIVVGDGANDVPMFQATGNGITFDWSKEVVRKCARHTIKELGDLPIIFS